ncbi:VpaChn25_0724 family phage protein [Alkalimonas mucilaginosa]|uniref:ArsR family transcriptional regulator n=1 Tax=Alkalimonas mucilaginosa TaxID=3057676 RepID=A0ABU7JHB5_9GAMM|nr:ArsR family transcriptional regulator [Alkalimonas sp. MEB004]MEE2025042.1 ArsR family transcriptional regulator [Alkalimonas sp. MEB004]
MAMSKILQEDRRLVILRSLNEMGGYEANESIINQCLEAYGHSVSRDTVRAEIAWLDEQQLVNLRDVAGYMVAKLTARGSDVATGKASVPGVKKPRPTL